MPAAKHNDYYWFLPNQKRMFAGTTLNVAEILRFESLAGVTLQGGRTVKEIRDALSDVPLGCIADVEPLEILDYYIARGYGDSLLRDIIAQSENQWQEFTRVINSRKKKGHQS